MTRSVTPRVPRLPMAAALLGSSFLQFAFAADIPVPDTGNGFSNGAALVAAINTANASADDDTIILDPAVHYVLDHMDNTTLGHTGLPVITSGITIRGGLIPPAAVTTIRREGSAEFFRIFLIGQHGRLTLELVQVSDGDAGDSSPPVGGGIYNDGGQLHMLRAQLSDNRANGGGGLYNTIHMDGGITSVGHALIEETTVEDNRVYDVGGGITNAGGLLTIDRSTISGNQADEHGGGVISFGSPGTVPDLRLINSTVSVNRTLGLRPNKAAGIEVSGGNALIEFSTIADNAGIGAFNNPGSGIIVLSNSILARNVTLDSSTGSATGADCFGAVLSDGYNLVSNTGMNCTLLARATDHIGRPTSPIDPLLGPLASSAGFTLTHEPMPGSIAIRSASTSRGRCPALDQRNMSRPLHPNPCDIGSFQTARCTGGALCSFDWMVSICARRPDYCRREIIPRLEKFLPMIPKLDPMIPDCLVDGPGCWGPPYQQPKK